MEALTFAAFSTTGIISCKTDKTVSTDLNTGLQNDMVILTKLASQVNSTIGEYTNQTNLKDSQNLSMFNPFYEIVTAENPFAEISDSDTNLSSGLANIKNGFDSIFNNLNYKIKQDYSNFYMDSNPLSYVNGSQKFSLSYIDLYQIGKMTGINISNIKAVQLQYTMVLELKFKTLSQKLPFTISYLITNDANQIGKLLSGTIETITKILIQYFKNYNNVIIDQVAEFNSIYSNFLVNYVADVSPLNSVFDTGLKNAVSNDNTIDPDLKAAIVFDTSGNKNLVKLVSSTITAENSGQLPNDFDIGTYQPGKWAGEGINPPGLTAENFVEAYKKNLPIFNVTKDSLMLAKLNINLSYISVYGLPLSGSLMMDNKIYESNILISKEGLESKLLNFGNLIVAFHKFYNVEIKLRSGSNTWENIISNSSVFNVSSSIFTQLQDNIDSKTKILNVLVKEFKKSGDAQMLPDLDLFNFVSLLDDQKAYIGTSGYTKDKIIFDVNYGSFASVFTFGQTRMNSIYYAAYGGNGGVSSKLWQAWMLFNKN